MLFRQTLIRLTVSLFFLVSAASAQTTFSLLRDDETEQLLTDLVHLFDQSDHSVRVLVVDHPSVNAFVVDHHTIYVHVGLINAVSEVGALIAILAHERGHQVAEHFQRIYQKQREIRDRLLAMLILSGGIGVVQGIAGAALLGPLSTMSSFRGLTSEIKVMELVADQWMIETMTSANLDLRPFARFVGQQSSLEPTNYFAAYVQTHPLWEERQQSLAIALDAAKPASPDQNFTPVPQTRYALVRAKIRGWTQQSAAADNQNLDRRQQLMAQFYFAAKRGDKKIAQQTYDQINAYAQEQDWPSESLFHTTIQLHKTLNNSQELYRLLGATIRQDPSLLEYRLLYVQTALDLYEAARNPARLSDLFIVLDQAYESGHAGLPQLFWLMGRVASQRENQPALLLARAWLALLNNERQRSNALYQQVDPNVLTQGQRRAWRDLEQILLES